MDIIIKKNKINERKRIENKESVIMQKSLTM